MAIQINCKPPPYTDRGGGFSSLVMKELGWISEQEAQREIKMLGKFAVVRIDVASNQYSFTRLHNSVEEARDEAERLARKERRLFCIIQVVGEVVLKDVETTWDKNFTAHNTIIPF